NADSRQWNWNANAIHTYTPAGGAFRATTSGGVQVEDRELSRSLAVAHGLLPGQSNIDQGSVFGQQFEINAPERTLAFYAQEEFMTLQERLLLSEGFRAERSSSNGNNNKHYLFPNAPARVTCCGQRIVNVGDLWNERIEIGAGVTPIQRPSFSWVFRTNFTSLKNRVQELPVPDLCAVGAAVCGFRPPNAGYGLAYGEFFIQQGRAITQIIGQDTVPGSGGAFTPSPAYLGQANPRFRWSFVNDLTYKRLAFSM